MDLKETDNIIVLGDMGLCWRRDREDLKKFIYRWEEKLEKRPWLYFIDGNHENFDLLKTFKDGIISTHIRWLRRGTVSYFEGKKCLFIGGADSIDKFRRTKHLSWWEDEQITKEDIENIWPGHYDYVFSHCCPYSIFKENKFLLADPQFDGEEFNHTSEEMLDKLINKITFDKWFFGHYHHDIQLNEKFSCLYDAFDMLI